MRIYDASSTGDTQHFEFLQVFNNFREAGMCKPGGTNKGKYFEVRAGIDQVFDSPIIEELRIRYIDPYQCGAKCRKGGNGLEMCA